MRLFLQQSPRCPSLALLCCRRWHQVLFRRWCRLQASTLTPPSLAPAPRFWRRLPCGRSRCNSGKGGARLWGSGALRYVRISWPFAAATATQPASCMLLPSLCNGPLLSSHSCGCKPLIRMLHTRLLHPLPIPRRALQCGVAVQVHLQRTPPAARTLAFEVWRGEGIRLLVNVLQLGTAHMSC